MTFCDQLRRFVLSVGATLSFHSILGFLRVMESFYRNKCVLKKSDVIVMGLYSSRMRIWSK
jgi:multisubunit Na+/H+ antiporter MnhG subunit